MHKSLFVLLLAFAARASAQSDTLTNHYVRLQPLQLLFRELVVGYEFPFTQKFTLEVGVGYRFRRFSHSPEIKGLALGMMGDYNLQNMGNPHYQAVKFSITPRYYLNARKTFFLATELFFRHWWFDNVQAKFDNTEGYRFDAVRTERMNVWGGKLLIGTNGKLFLLGKNPVYWTPFLGFGLRSKTYTYETWDGTLGDTPVTYQKERGTVSLSPSIHLGVSLAYRLR